MTVDDCPGVPATVRPTIPFSRMAGCAFDLDAPMLCPACGGRFTAWRIETGMPGAFTHSGAAESSP